MGCCQGTSNDNELIFDKSNSDPLSFRPAISSESESKVAPTPSFGSGNKRFLFEVSE
jgi:hypothetical protein